MKKHNQQNFSEAPFEILSDLSLRMQRRKAIVKSAILLAVVAAMLVAFICLFGIAKVNGTSMEPTLFAGDTVLIWKPACDYQTGDIIVYDSGNGVRNVKRIAAVAGDTVDFDENGRLMVNGEIATENYVYVCSAFITESNVVYPYTVQKDTVYVLGDNRITSVDSRKDGAIEVNKIVGTPIWVIRNISDK